MTRILVASMDTPSYRYVELSPGEELCEKCGGAGRHRIRYGGNYCEQRDTMACPDCGGDGKRLRCSNCGHLERHGILKHPERPDLDSLCFNCIRAELRMR